MAMNSMTLNASDWVLTQFTRKPAVSRQLALVSVVAGILSIALADYFSEIRISLTVFYFVPILLAVAWLGVRAAIGVAVASIAFKIIGDLVEASDHSLPLWGWWNAGSTLLVLLLVVWVFGKLLSVYRQLETRVAERTKEILDLSEHRRLLERELLTVSSNERNLMGQELHDEICQHLVGTTLAAQVLSQRLSQQNNPLASDAQAIIGLIESGIGKTRQLARGLLLSEITPDELPDLLTELADEADRSGVACKFRQSGNVRVPDPATAAQLYRIAQEALRNAIRHAGASRVEVSLVGDQRNVSLSVEDDGRGMTRDKSSSGMGLPIMSHRAAYIGATLSLTRTAGQGTRMTCVVPLG
jgi:signal transduction histidine kinase